jgi:hypothetical protein
VKIIYYWIALFGLTLLAINFRIQEYDSYKKYNGMKGVVIDTYTSQGRHSSTEIPTIKLEDGSVEAVNGGHHKWKIGEEFINEIGFNWIFGSYGTAYYVNPEENILKVVFCMLVTLILIVSLIWLVLSLFVEWA